MKPPENFTIYGKTEVIIKRPTYLGFRLTKLKLQVNDLVLNP